MPMKIILGGPPHSGKSCLREGLKQAIRTRSRYRVYPYVITACPDGEGAWFQKAVQNDPVWTRRQKDRYRRRTDEAFTRRVAAAVRTCANDPTLVDIGGRIGDDNREICASATHAILIAGDSENETWRQRLSPWQRFCAELAIRPIALLHSDYSSSEDQLFGVHEDVLTGSIHYMERGEPIETRPTVVALADHLLDLLEARRTEAAVKEAR